MARPTSLDLLGDVGAKRADALGQGAVGVLDAAQKLRAGGEVVEAFGVKEDIDLVHAARLVDLNQALREDCLRALEALLGCGELGLGILELPGKRRGALLALGQNLAQLGFFASCAVRFVARLGKGDDVVLDPVVQLLRLGAGVVDLPLEAVDRLGVRPGDRNDQGDATREHEHRSRGKVRLVRTSGCNARDDLVRTPRGHEAENASDSLAFANDLLRVAT